MQATEPVMAFETFPAWINALVFAASAALVWVAGARLARYADAIAERTGLGHAMLGVLLLGGVTSLPDLTVAGTAALSGAAPLAVNNMLGGVTLQVAVLAAADAAVPRRALTGSVADPIVLLQGVLCMLLAGFAATGIVAGDVALLGAGVWTWALAVATFLAFRLVATPERTLGWRAEGAGAALRFDEDDERAARDAPRALGLKTFAAAGVILAAGVALALSAETLASQTGLGMSFFGAVFVAIATSLPELSTAIAAARLGLYVMAISDIFGTNLLNIGFIFLIDLIYSGEPVLNEVGALSTVAALMGVVVTGIYLVGLIERRDRTFAGLGYDSWTVAAAYFGGIAILYTLR